jgi:putative tricarboxylic transport membrane protein
VTDQAKGTGSTPAVSASGGHSGALAESHSEDHSSGHSGAPSSGPLASPSGGTLTPVRLGWAAAGLLGLVASWEAWGYRVAFITDAAGPRALPLFAASLLVLGALGLVIRPEDGPVGASISGGAGLRRPLAAAALLFVIPVAIPWLGFIVTAGGAMAGLAMLLRGRPGPALFAGLTTAAALYALFVYALGVTLPVGSLFLASGSGGG